MSYTMADVHRLYFQTKDEVDLLSKRHAGEMAPLSQRLDQCKQAMLMLLNASGQESATTEYGNCHKLVQTSVTLEKDGGWDHLLGFVLGDVLDEMCKVTEAGGSEEDAIMAARQSSRLAFFNRAVNKTAVMDQLEQDKTFDPASIGVKVGQVLQVGVRRS